MKTLKSLLISLILLLSLHSISTAEYFTDIIMAGTKGNWTDSRSFTTINDAVTAIGSNERTLVISSPQSVTTLTIPSNITLQFEKDGSINNSGQLTINTTNIIAPNRQIFTGVGDIDFASGSIIKTGWFSNIESAFALTADDTITLIVSKPQTITASYSPGNNVHLKWESPGNILTVNAGVTVDNISQVTAGNYQLFAGAGNFRFLDGTSINLDWFSNLRAAITYASTNNLTLLVQGTHTVDLSDTAPSTLSIKMNQGGIFAISTGVTLTINGSFEAGLYQVFDCTGTGNVGGLKESFPEWWTANEIPGTTEMGTAIQKAITASRKVVLSNTTYRSTTNLVISDWLTTIEGNGATITYYGTGTALEIATNVRYCNLKNFTISKASVAVAPTSALRGLSVLGNNNKITNVSVVYSGAYTYEPFYYGAYVLQWTNTFKNCTFRGYYAGVYVYKANAISLNSCFLVGQLHASAYFVQGSGNSLVSCDLEGSGLYSLRIHADGPATGGNGSFSMLGGYIENATSRGIYISGSLGLTLGSISIYGVYINNAAGVGIYATYADGLAINGCEFRLSEAGTYGIEIATGCTNVDIGAGNKYDSTLTIPVYISANPTKGSIFDTRFNTYKLFGYSEVYEMPSATNEDATPDVTGIRFLKTANTGATTITALDNMQNGQIVTIVCTDALTTITSGGNWSINGNFDSSTSKAITVIKDGVSYREINRY